ADGRRRADELLERHGLGEWGAKPIRTLSKGMAQTVQLLGTLVHRPRLIVLDEPFSGLDKAGVEQLLDYLSKSPQTALIATHDPDRAWRVVDTFVHLEAGRLL
ncbi:MAG: ATP-binding cassette domain-containing protein, partial [Actinobacteria bacterium]|nr:ATP-binding cassette domain-containing protein [Actinomycetota bacterium]